ncbi:Epoxide hydrolase-like [Parasponia andersonii]|uniref:Epoxide hydrolase-like n=1 Tax=Parasponia andersonii TaxID=3476 RepID=A0A2P5DCV9_PARAD|nr:Epoxide hydrolase-like [Parasponia andersonii]
MELGVSHHLFATASAESFDFNFKSTNIKFSSSSFLSKFYLVGLQSSRIVSASASSVSGSSADYSEQLLDGQTKQKVKTIAGIDQDELVDPSVLADPDSCFCEFKGVQIHHKVYEPESKEAAESLQSQNMSHPVKKIGLPMILLHGFGASVFSWNRVMKALAEVTGSKVLAFDRPAFGLTSRLNFWEQLASGNGDAKPLNPYSMAFSVLATLYFIDFLGAEKAILVGHSAGSLVAVNSYFEAPERVAALILVAPAILAPRAVQKVEGNQMGEDNKINEENSDSNSQGNPFIQLCNMLSEFAKLVLQAITRVVKGMTDMLNSLYKKFLSAILRSAFAVMLVRMIIDKFGLAAVKNSWHDSNKVTEHILHGYTKPLRTKNWDKALLEYTAAMLTNTEPESKPRLSNRLHEISCPVLIITGDNDRLVPSWNSEWLSRAIPGSCFEVIKHCGHLPHEEKEDEFVSVVQKFLQRAFGNGDSLKEQYCAS